MSNNIGQKSDKREGNAVKKIGVFGGAFNPPHKGHVALAKGMADSLGLDEVLIIPSYISPHKSSSSLAGGEHRLAMCRLAFGDDPRFTVSAMELDRGGKSYTVETLREIKKNNPDAALYLIVGSDMFLSFNTWRCYEEILQLATLCAASRKQGLHLAENPYKALIVDLPVLEMSSTDLRKKLAEGGNVEEFVGKKVAQYMESEGLYRD